MEKRPNDLIRETSPYLQQHAYNPVQWVPWTEKNLERAGAEDKLLLISIGYAACHWCHVMETECFEDPEVAEVMNTLFIPVKVDREERPDVDQIYMDALQLMTGSGGWPLNIVALPDGRPFWGATYLPKDRWLRALTELGRLYRNDPDKVREYASDLSSALSRINLPVDNPEGDLPDLETVSDWVEDWKKRFDQEYGGMKGAPKFMMPVTLELLMHLARVRPDREVDEHIGRSLKYMAYGGLYDQLGGGFSRYSVDARWHVPHFEKMLYDNAQLIGLYSRGYAQYGDPLYRETVSGTISFILRELKNPAGGFYASLDADSFDARGNLVEGAYYSWDKAEIKEVLGPDFDLFAAAYSLDEYGEWEGGKYVLTRREDDAGLARRMDLPEGEIRDRLVSGREKLLARREKREPPRLDDKIVTSWNGLLLSGLADAWRYCGLEAAREASLELARYLSGSLTRPDGSVPHIAGSTGDVGNGFLEDYAALADGYIAMHGALGDPAWMEQARAAIETALENFSEAGQPLFYFNSHRDPELIRRTLETSDNVIPASNSIMAKNLYQLGLFFDRREWTDRARSMLRSMVPSLQRHSGQHSNWMQLALWLNAPFHEVAVCGPDAESVSAELRVHYLPQVLLASSTTESGLPLFRGRFHPERTRIYICREGQCDHPLEDRREVLEKLGVFARG